MNLVNCITSLQKIAKLSMNASPDAKSLAHITTRATECFGREQAQPRHVSGALWSCAKLQLVQEALLQAAFQAGSLMQPAWFKPQEVSMAVWAVGKLHGAGMSPACGEAAAALVAKLLPSALARSKDFDPQGLANLVSGVAAVGTAGRPGVDWRRFLDRFCVSVRPPSPAPLGHALLPPRAAHEGLGARPTSRGRDAGRCGSTGAATNTCTRATTRRWTFSTRQPLLLPPKSCKQKPRPAQKIHGAYRGCRADSERAAPARAERAGRAQNRQRLATVFRFLDANNDGVLTRTEARTPPNGIFLF